MERSPPPVLCAFAHAPVAGKAGSSRERRPTGATGW